MHDVRGGRERDRDRERQRQRQIVFILFLWNLKLNVLEFDATLNVSKYVTTIVGLDTSNIFV